jgi:hypothetical protein
MIRHKTANEMIDAMVEVVDKELDRGEPNHNAEWVLHGLHANQLRQVRNFLRSFQQAETPPTRDSGFYWVRFKQRDFTDPQRTHGDNAWPWLDDEHRQVAYYYDTQPAPPRWYCLGAFRNEDEFEAIGARLPDFDGQSNEYQRGWLDAMMRVREFEDREAGRIIANWLAEPRIRGF